RFCRELPRAWPTNRRFWCMTHPAYVRDDVIAALYSVGLEEVCLGVQSGSDRILHIYRRGTTRDEILAACRILAQYPIGVKIDIISANPVEFLDDRLATMDLIQRMPRNPRWKPGLSRLTVFPGSGISRFVTQAQCEETHGDYQDFVDGLYRAAFVPRWYPIDLVDAMRRYVDFRAFRAARPWPDPAGPLSDEFWLPLSTWLDEGAPR
ncbi:MAG: hypothetical protein KKE65_04240, partial [Actinobacteria bacterium]|nr:hypothetical protein [Actinomycetota bacterium]